MGKNQIRTSGSFGTDANSHLYITEVPEKKKGEWEGNKKTFY